MKKTNIPKVPPTIPMAFFCGKPALVLDTATSVYKAQFGVTKFASNNKTLELLAPETESLKDVMLDIANGNNSLLEQRLTLIISISWKLHRIALQTVLIASDDMNTYAVTLKECGFKISSNPKPTPVLEGPKNLRQVKNQSAGLLSARINKVDAAGIYSYECAEVAEDGTFGAWEAFQCSYVNYTFTNLKPGKLYAVRVGATSKDGLQTIYSLNLLCTSGVGAA